MLATLPPLMAFRNTPELQAFGSCCKLLKAIVDDLRPSLHFPATEQQSAERYLKKQPHLTTVSIHYSEDACDIHSSLTSLQIVLPGLTSLALSYDYKAVTVFDNALIPWSGTLQRLKLRGTNLSPFTEKRYRSLRLSCLSKLSALTELELVDVLPVLSTKVIYGCTSLLKLVLRTAAQLGREKHRVTLDLTSCTSLQELRCTSYNITSLNLKGLRALQRLDCNSNAIVQLDVSTCTALQELSCHGNPLQILDLRGARELRELDCCSTPLLSLQVSNCAQLSSLSCGGCEFEGLDLSGCSSLKQLYCVENQLSSLDMQPCPDLAVLDMRNSKSLHSLCLKGFRHLHTLHMCGTQDSIALLDLSGCTALEGFECYSSSSLEVLRVTGCSRLVTLSCLKCPRLRELECQGCDSLQHVSFEGSGEFSGATVASLVGKCVVAQR